jgi:chromosome segregation ATPase
LKLAEERAKEYEDRVDSLNAKIIKVESSLVEKESEKKAVQSELDDLLMVFEDLEEKAEKYKRRLKELGESVSDEEDGDEDGVEDGTAEDGDGVD